MVLFCVVGIRHCALRNGMVQRGDARRLRPDARNIFTTGRSAMKYTDELRSIARDAPMSAGTRTRLHAIAHNIDGEIERLRRDVESWKAAYNASRANEERLRGLLRTYGRHLDCCGDADSYNHADIPSCGCGFDAVLDEATTDQPQAVKPRGDCWVCSGTGSIEDACYKCHGTGTITDKSVDAP
jgi:hypothetical protein